ASSLQNAHWQFTTGTAANPWLYLTSSNGVSTTPQGTLLTGQSTSLPVFQETITGQVLSQQSHSYAYSGCDDGGGGTCNYGLIQNYTYVDDHGDTQWRASWTYNYAISGRLFMTQSVKSDNQFQVDFGGNASGVLNVVSNGSVIFANSIINPSGSLTINARASGTTSGSITQTTTSPILTGSLNAVAAGGIGTTAAPLNVTLTTTAGGTPGALSARAGSDGININLNSGATLGTVSSGSASSGFGDVSITASGDLLAGSNALVSGRNITLISSGGSVGTLATPLNISANATPLTAGGYQGGVVNVAAHGDIALTQNAASALFPGDLRIGLIASASGDVQLNVPRGQILDASGQTAAQALSPSQVSAIAQALRLTPLDGSNAAALSVITGFETTVNRDLADYTRLVGLGSVQNGVFVLNVASLDTYRALATAALGHAASDTETQTYANGLYQAFVADFTRAYGSGWQNNAAITAYTAYAALSASGTLINGTFTLNAESVASYRNAATAALGLVGRTATDAETRTYAASLYTTLKAQVTYSATPGVAFSLLNASGTLQNGTFVLTNTGLLSYASQALTATNYGAFRNLLSNGTLSSGTFALTSAGVTATAATVLSQDYTNFQNLTAYGTVQNGTLTLNAAGIAYFRQAASTTLNPNPTDAQVQTFANGLYQSYAQTINTAENAQYQNLLQSISQSASATYASLANEVLTAYCAGNNSCTTAFRAQFLADNNYVMNYAYLIGSTDSTKLRALVALGTVTNGVFALSAGNVAGYASQGLSAADLASYTNLLANGTITGGTLTLNAAGLALYAQSPLTTNFQTFQALSNGGGTQLGTYVFSNSGVQAFAQSGLSSAYQGYQTLVSNGALANGVFTLTANGITAYRSFAASALGIANPTDAQVQAYADQQYQNSVFASGNATYQQYSQTISTGAQSQLQTLLGIVRNFADNNWYNYG
ncbi:MAG: hypothetical protein JWP29_5518, partial [Rhodoferax sp.]|nr:hypothetical protein [Rhodoferax sp.]